MLQHKKNLLTNHVTCIFTMIIAALVKTCLIVNHHFAKMMGRTNSSLYLISWCFQNFIKASLHQSSVTDSMRDQNGNFIINFCQPSMWADCVLTCSSKTHCSANPPKICDIPATRSPWNMKKGQFCHQLPPHQQHTVQQTNPSSVPYQQIVPYQQLGSPWNMKKDKILWLYYSRHKPTHQQRSHF